MYLAVVKQIRSDYVRNYSLNLKNEEKKIYSGHIKSSGSNPSGDKISFTNYYMEMNGEPFFAISGEFHYSRYDERYWEEEIVKMKVGGINIISTYIFWNHHEEVQGVFEWEGNKNLRAFIKLCKKHDIFVIVRIGPFDHGEVRNGGMPDWLFGRPFEVRSNDAEYLLYVDKLYKEIGKQLVGLLYKDGGPIIGTQIENEYMHSAAPWELTTGISNEWIPGGNDGEEHLKTLKDMAINHGIDTPIYTCTAWGGAAAPIDEMIPLWGGYAFWPWIFNGDVKEHPVTPEYIFRDYHNNMKPKCYNFDPTYENEAYPYSCCEMGGGMNVFYKYRFIFPAQSVPAMAVIKVAGGCNFIGYYMYHGGSNPKGKVNPYLNEVTTPKISYDFQAALGEYGQVRESYKGLKLQHYFFKDFEKLLCPMKSIIPEEAETMVPRDIDTLRYAARVKDGSGFIFINNYQDHLETKEQKDFAINLELTYENLRIPLKGEVSLGKDANCILPFNFNIEGSKLKYSTTQLITVSEYNNEKYYFFYSPKGMKGEYCFDANEIKELKVDNGYVKNDMGNSIIHVDEDSMSNIRFISGVGKACNICTLTTLQSLNFWKIDIDGTNRIIISDATLIPLNGELKLESKDKEIINVSIFPRPIKDITVSGAQIINKTRTGLFINYELKLPKKEIHLDVKNVKDSKAVISIAKEEFLDVKDILLRINYAGDIGYAFIDGDLINDNFCNGGTWEIGLKRFEREITEKGMYIYISPIKKGAKVSSDSTMAARVETSTGEIAKISSIKVAAVSEASIKF